MLLIIIANTLALMAGVFINLQIQRIPHTFFASWIEVWRGESFSARVCWEMRKRLRDHCARFFERQNNIKGGAFVHFRMEGDGAAGFIHYSLCDIEA